MMKYSNNWQHLIMSIATMFVGVFLYVRGVTGVGVGLISLVTTTWFVPGVVKQVATQITEELEAWVLRTYGPARQDQTRKKNEQDV